MRGYQNSDFTKNRNVSFISIANGQNVLTVDNGVNENGTTNSKFAVSLKFMNGYIISSRIIKWMYLLIHVGV